MFWLGLAGCMASSPAAAAAASSDSKAVELLQWVGLHRIQRWLVCKQRSVWNNCTRGGKELQKKNILISRTYTLCTEEIPTSPLACIAEGPECLTGNGGYIIYDPEHVAFHRIISKIMPRIILTNHKTNLLQCHAWGIRQIILPKYTRNHTSSNHTSHATRFPDTRIFWNIIWHLLSRQMLSGVGRVMIMTFDIAK